MPKIVVPADPLDIERLCADLVSIATNHPNAKARALGNAGSAGYRIRLCAWWRNDRRPSAYIKPFGDAGGDGSLVWGDSGTGERGGWKELAAVLGVDPFVYQNGHAPAPQPPPPKMPTDSRGAERGTPRGATVHPYHDASGALVLEKVRTNRADRPKCYIRQPAPDYDDFEGDVEPRIYDRAGAWYWRDGDGVPDVLYRLPELLASDDLVFVTEGEKDADTLAALGLTATTAMHNWRSGTGAALAGRRVAVLMDHDRPGLARAEATAKDLRAHGAHVVGPLWLPGEALEADLPDKRGRDVTDWAPGREDPRAELLALVAERDTGFSDDFCWFPDGLSDRIEWLLEPWLQVGKAHALVGAASSGKSTLALQWAADLAHNGHRVLYIVLEGHPDALMRLHAWCKVTGAPIPQSLRRWAPNYLMLTDEPTVTAICDRAQADGIDFIVLDTLAQSMAGHDENSSEYMGMLTRFTGRLASREIASLVVHHFGKDEKKGARGHSSFTGNVDIELSLVNDAATQRTLRIKKIRTGSNMGPWVFDMDAVLLDDEGPSAPYLRTVGMVATRPQATTPETMQKLMRALAAQPDHQAFNRPWQRAAEVYGGAFDRARQQLLADGLVTSMSGIYLATRKGLEWIGAK